MTPPIGLGSGRGGPPPSTLPRTTATGPDPGTAPGPSHHPHHQHDDEQHEHHEHTDGKENPQ